MTTFTTLASPLGDLLAFADGDVLTGLYLPGHAHGRQVSDGDRPDAAPFAALREQLGLYLAGELTQFSLPVRLDGTEFQRRVWERLSHVPYGRTVTYGQIAAELGLAPGAARAVGTAVGRNPVSIVVPCHRVLGAGGAMTGYAGGLPAKQYLLNLEGVRLGW